MDKKKAKEKDCSKLLKVLADETRLAALELLMSGPKHVGEINSVLKIDQSLLSHHLKVLRDNGLIFSQRDGKAVLYRLSPGVSIPHTGRAINLGCCLITFK